MTPLYQLLATEVDKWRDQGYPCADYPAIAELLEYQTDAESGALRFLRRPQLRALETYWYLRLVKRTPHVLKLYEQLYPKRSEMYEAFGVNNPALLSIVLDGGPEALWERIKDDDALVKKYGLDALRETLNLDYPSYILALAMGVGKTVLIGTIVATEFAMAMTYPDAPFVQNALVFAPGTTIIEPLRELARMRYDQLLPPRYYYRFAPNFKATFTRDGESDVSVIPGSRFNLVVTNIEKIRIQKRPVRKQKGWTPMQLIQMEEREEETANRRLRTIASLPNLAVFSDEAHHTYGQELGTRIKRVRQTVDYLHASTDVVCVVNTTGTPYYGRQPLKDVVVWYGLAEGIRDNILKSVEDSIQTTRFDRTDQNMTARFVADIISDFFRDYADVRLPNGARAKLALYFPQNHDIDELRPAIDTAINTLGRPDLSPALVLRNTSESSKQEVDEFNRLNDPTSPYRVILLVNKGTEGWNCPSLFACALVRKLTTSNNFLLQAATRCLRQVPGNNARARIYIADENRSALDNQLQETYGETLASFSKNAADKNTAVLRLRLNPDATPRIPAPLVLPQVIRTTVRTPKAANATLTLTRPAAAVGPIKETTVSTLGQQGQSVFRTTDERSVELAPDALDLYTAAVQLAARYRLDLLALLPELRRIYAPADEVPVVHLDLLGQQIEDLTGHYTTIERNVNLTLAIVKPEGWRDPQTGRYETSISYRDDKRKLIIEMGQFANPHDFGFHYHPYNFDSEPESSFFTQMLTHMNLHPDAVENIYYTGAITDPDKTDFFFEYADNKGKMHRYTPDFIIRLKPQPGEADGSGKCLVVEIKSSQYETTVRQELDEGQASSSEGLKARRLVQLAAAYPEQIDYDIIFAGEGELPRAKSQREREFIETGV